MKPISSAASALLILQLYSITATAQTINATDPLVAAVGADSFDRHCTSCHTPENIAPLITTNGAQGNVRAPTLEILRELSPSAIVTALTTGKMQVQGVAMSQDERIAVARYITGRPYDPSEPVAFTADCDVSSSVASSYAQPGWNGWGNGQANTRYQSAAAAGLSAADVPRLELAWAFGFPDVSSARTQPAIIGQWLFTASDKGQVFALDAKTGCMHWSYQAQAAVRSAISIAPSIDAEDGSTRYLALFGDTQANAYAVDAETGALIWAYEIESHPNGSITGAPAVLGNLVYFSVSASGEEVRGTNPDYECCTFRGSVSALDLGTGAMVWKTYSIAQQPVPRGTSSTGRQLYGPAGAGIWNSPTIDVERAALYVGTGNGFAEPQPATTDSILALDLASGSLRWVQQTTPDDVWLYQCESEANRNNANCPTVQGPDFDFGASPVLTRTNSGRALIIATQKSGMVYALDPDADGARVWEYRIGEGSDLGGQWGAATDGENVYVGVADTFSAAPGGLHAIALERGQRRWFAQPRPTLCEGGAQARCFAAQGGAVSVIPGVVFSGGSDGGLRAYSTQDGALLWEYDTNRSFDTVNGVAATGATIDAAGPVVVDGMVYVNSGYTGIVGRGGNVLLAFRVTGE